MGFTWLGKSINKSLSLMRIIFVNPARKISPTQWQKTHNSTTVWKCTITFLFTCRLLAESYISECRPAAIKQKPPVTNQTERFTRSVKLKKQWFAFISSTRKCRGLHLFCACYLHVHDCFVHYFVPYLQMIPLHECNSAWWQRQQQLSPLYSAPN